jgi:hypothetical protein
MPVNGYTVGRDIVICVQTPSGPLTLNGVTKFTKKRDTTNKKVKLINGVTDPLVFPDGWSGAIEIERQDSTVDDYFAALEAGYYAGQNQESGTITETITEVSGAISQYQYTRVVLNLTNAGDAMADETVKLTIDWSASRRIKLA